MIPSSKERLLEVRISYHLLREGYSLLIYHTTFTGKFVRCSYSIPPSYHLHIGKVARCSYLITPI
jgi:hypothetical protein